MPFSILGDPDGVWAQRLESKRGRPSNVRWTTPEDYPTSWNRPGKPVRYLKLAWTLVSCVIVTLHVGERPLHAPLQPIKLAPAAGVAVSETVEPS